MIKFEEDKLYYFKAVDSTRMIGECIERSECAMEETLVFRFSEEGLFCRCLIEYPLNNFEEVETTYCRLGDKLYMSDSRWVSE